MNQLKYSGLKNQGSDSNSSNTDGDPAEIAGDDNSNTIIVMYIYLVLQE